jgi:hypothetical protein
VRGEACAPALMTFSATAFFTIGLRARHTTPIPPRPMYPVIS